MSGVSDDSRPNNFQRDISALLLFVVVAATILAEYSALNPAKYVATLCLIGYAALEWRRLRGNARILVVVCAALGLWVSLATGSCSAALDALTRSAFYPAFLGALGFLRDAASVSPMVERGGRYLVDQPPARRYAALTFGGHIFGVLLNMGGLALIASMVRQANTLASAGGDERRRAIREKRMAVAVLRGFSTMPMWCPLSITMALLFSLTPQAHWSDYAPYGLALTFVYLALGWAVDFMSYPRSRDQGAAHSSRGWVAIPAMIAQVGAMTTIALLMEKYTGVRFLTHMLVVVPIFALGWSLVQHWRPGQGPDIWGAISALARQAARNMPTYANEVTLFATSGFMGAVVARLLPADSVAHLIASLHLSVDGFLVVMVVVVAGLGVVGVNPMITLTLILGSLASAPIAGLSPLKLVVTAAGAWSLSLGCSPLNGSMVMFANIIGVRSETIAFRWNGWFAAGTIALFCVAIYFAPL